MRSYLKSNYAAELRLHAAERRGRARGTMPAITNEDYFYIDGHERLGGPYQQLNFTLCHAQPCSLAILYVYVRSR